MRSRLRVLWCVIAACLPAFAGAQPDRVAHLENSVLAPCCYTEPVSRHQSEIAMKMRLEIAKWVEQGRSDEDILAEYVARYGAKVLVDPSTLPRPWSYWVPWVLVALASVGTGALVLRLRRAAPAPAPAFAGPLPDLPPDEE
ncbi:MAG: cytochrome c-type biogenesis protein CcmH [Acidobacteria bacterium]|nr:cytochrome c-type biogenesis protein CcmH [Acidobacteriota bacterium]